MRSAALLFSIVCLMISREAIAQSAPSLDLMPEPASVTHGSSGLRIYANFQIAFTGYTEPRLDRAGERFLTQLRRQTGLLVAKPARDARKATLVAHTDHASKEVQELGEDESYMLEVTSTGAKLSA